MPVGRNLSPDQVKIHTQSTEVVGHLRNITQGAAHLILPKALQTNEAVRIEFRDDCLIQGSVLYCSPMDNGYRAAVSFQGDGLNLRTEERYCVPQESAKIVSLVSLRAFEATVVDVSRSGMGLKTSFPVSMAELVKIEMKNALVFGDVRHCREDPAGGYRVGVRIETLLSRTEDDCFSMKQLPEA